MVGNVLCQGEKWSVTSRRRNDTTDKPGCENTADVNAVVAHVGWKLTHSSRLPVSFSPLPLQFFSTSCLTARTQTHSYTCNCTTPPPLPPIKAQRPSPAHTLLLVSRRDSGVGQTLGERSRKPFPAPAVGQSGWSPADTSVRQPGGGERKKKIAFYYDTQRKRNEMIEEKEVI